MAVSWHSPLSAVLLPPSEQLIDTTMVHKLCLLVVGLLAVVSCQELFQNNQLTDTSESDVSGRAISSPGTAADLLQGIYRGCLEEGDFSCVKPKVLAFLSASVSQDKIRISRDLSIVRKQDAEAQKEESRGSPLDSDPALLAADPTRRQAVRQLMLDRVDDFLSSHELRVRLPKELTNPELLAYVPDFLLKNLPQELRVPLSDSPVEEGRRRGGMLRKVIIPFLLGLKFKVSALMPLALALIALKTWKALTLGLLSIVLSAAMVIFKITKPKVLNYEIVHLPHPAPVVEHYDHHHGYGRALGGQPLAYRAYFKQAN